MNNKENKNILQITDYAAPYEGNFINSLKVLEEHLNKKKIKMIYMFPKTGKEIEWVNDLKDNCNEANGRKVTFLFEGILENIKIIRSVIKENNIKIIHSHFCLPKTQLAIKICCILEKNVKLVQHYHNHFQLPSNLLKKYLFKYIFEGDFNIGCSDSVAKSIIYNPKKVVSIPNAIYFPRLDRYEEIDRKKLGIRENSKVILMFGFDYYRKGVDIAIKAIKPIAEEYNITLMISISVGIDNIKNKIKEEFGSMPDWIKIVTARSDVSSLYHVSDIFLSSSREEGLCYSVIEAVYCKTICICSKISGHPLDIPSIQLFEKENSGELTEIIKKIMNFSSNEKEIITQKSKEYVLAKYDIDKWSENIIKLYEN
ncbi:MAG: glycosyltransferase family 4 protein [Clostridium sp.]|nr:glycosyltransferase family 4 protein [Clostridium sp.]